MRRRTGRSLAWSTSGTACNTSARAWHPSGIGLRRERDRLKQELAAAQRTRKRQAAPFSKGTPQSAPRKPGRKGEPKYGPKRRRDIPAQVDEELAAPRPAGCPACCGVVAHDRVEEQYQEAIVRTVRVTRIRVHIGHCVACGTRVQGRHPRQPSDALGAAAAQLGPDASALATLLNTQMGLSLGKTAAVLQQTFGLRVTPGGVSPAVARVGRQCTPTYAALTQRVGASASVTIDDTGWRVGGVPHWLFAAATTDATVFAIAAGRGTADAETLLSADFDGFLVRDGAAIYRAFATPYQQTCNNPLIHRCTRLLEQASAATAVFPREVKALLQPGLALRDRFAAEGGLCPRPEGRHGPPGGGTRAAPGPLLSGGRESPPGQPSRPGVPLPVRVSEVSRVGGDELSGRAGDPTRRGHSQGVGRKSHRRRGAHAGTPDARPADQSAERCRPPPAHR